MNLHIRVRGDRDHNFALGRGAMQKSKCQNPIIMKIHLHCGRRRFRDDTTSRIFFVTMQKSKCRNPITVKIYLRCGSRRFRDNTTCGSFFDAIEKSKCLNPIIVKFYLRCGSRRFRDLTTCRSFFEQRATPARPQSEPEMVHWTKRQTTDLLAGEETRADICRQKIIRMLGQD